MKIAALYDIHGNFPALNAVLEELEVLKLDIIIVGGDIVSGPMPVQTLNSLFHLCKKIQIRFIRGNGDREVAKASKGNKLLYLSEKGSEIQHWVSKQLTSSQLDFLASLPDKTEVHSGTLGNISTPDSNKEIFTPATLMTRLKTIFKDTNQQIVVCGHTHMQFKKQIEKLSVRNAGSVQSTSPSLITSAF
ncbi:metallophosphoesterase family protein [Bacillaceae bacterium Marseille-Q3522]|nr:metallophosphoesterase family protein [Bacillaceae bacterium Marseille-Q3522]